MTGATLCSRYTISLRNMSMTCTGLTRRAFGVGLHGGQPVHQVDDGVQQRLLVVTEHRCDLGGNSLVV